MELSDTHCHLQFDKLASDVSGVLARSAESGVTRLLCVGTSATDSHEAAKLAGRFDNVWAAVGAHPHSAKDFDFQNDSESIRQLLSEPKVTAVGEIGLDFYKDYSPKNLQEKLFKQVIETGLPSGLPFVFHVRDAWDDFWRIFDDYKGLHGVIHSFSSGTKQLDAALSRGLYIGLNGIMTFTKDQAQLEAARQVPLNRLLLETDAPFLTPAPFRGQLCEPKHILNIAEFLAGLRDESVGDITRATTDNAVRLFNLK